MIPPAISASHRRLIDSKVVDVLSEPTIGGDGQCHFRCAANLPSPNVEHLPARVELDVAIPLAYPFAPVEVFALDPAVRGFPHQDAETHKLCLREERLAPCDTNRLLTYLKWANEWLSNAASGTLLAAGDPYELPDFSRKRAKLKLPTEKPLWFAESSESYPCWQNHVGESGRVDIVELNTPPILVPLVFRDSEGSAIWEPPFSETFLSKREPVSGAWVLIPRLAYYRHRPAQRFGELREMLSQSNIPLDEVLQNLWLSQGVKQLFSVLLVGSPIPRQVGESSCEVHWQPLLIENGNARCSSFQRKRADKQLQRWKTATSENRFGVNVEIPWGLARNVAEDRLRARGAVTGPLHTQKLAVIGCGALGSALADLLTRAGARDLSLFDHDTFEIGNNARHVLDGQCVEHSKAISLATRKATGNPYGRIRGFLVHLPHFNSDHDRVALAALENADIIVDCSVNETLLCWLSHFARERGKRVAHLFINFHATFLTLVLSGRNTSCQRAFTAFCKASRAGEVKMNAADIVEYFRDPDKTENVLPGAGCWHATFPARMNHIQMLVAAAFDSLEELLKSPPQCDGWVVVYRRRAITTDGEVPTPIVEELCCGRYR